MEPWLYLMRCKYIELDNHTQRELYHSFYKLVYTDIYSFVKEHSVTEDIIQEAFVKVVLKGKSPTHSTNLRGWLKQVARNTTIDWLRKNKKNSQQVQLGDVIIVDDSPPVSLEVETIIKGEVLRQAIDELKPQHSILISMFYFEGKTYKEICKELHLTEPIVTQRLARARQKLKLFFSRKWKDVYE